MKDGSIEEDCIDEKRVRSSSLGTLEYWEDTYRRELFDFTNYKTFGEAWFGELISKIILKWIVGNCDKDDKILDIGCGNAMFTNDISKIGYTSVHGIDYSKNAIDLAKKISELFNISTTFEVSNILQDLIPPTYKLAMDRGTYDAISLDPEDSKSKMETYVRNVHNLLIDGGSLLITSCNWTEEELREQFESHFTHVETLPTPSFEFGGSTGRTVTSIAFKKK